MSVQGYRAVTVIVGSWCVVNEEDLFSATPRVKLKIFYSNLCVYLLDHLGSIKILFATSVSLNLNT